MFSNFLNVPPSAPPPPPHTHTHTQEGNRMSLYGSFLCDEQFQCSICLEVFINPSSTPCGHSFCMSCISRYWDQAKVTTTNRPSIQPSILPDPPLFSSLLLRCVSVLCVRKLSRSVRSCRLTEL